MDELERLIKEQQWDRVFPYSNWPRVGSQRALAFLVEPTVGEWDDPTADAAIGVDPLYTTRPLVRPPTIAPGAVKAPHGITRYRHWGCRCTVCKAAKAAERRKLNARRKANRIHR